MEFPGYGLFKSEVASCDNLTESANTVFRFVLHTMNYQAKDVILIGRSMGSGPACHLASVHRPAALILLSPFSSLKDAVKSILGKIPSLLVRDRFINRQVVQSIDCPILFIHGQAD
jgi:fermentation-respiration switch protein FrsA (DUF1100 family)